MKADLVTETEVKGVLQAFADAYGKRQLTPLLQCIASDADVLLYGTGADEKRVGLEQIRAQVERDWAQTETIAMEFASMAVSSAGPVAWAAADGAFLFRVDGQEKVLPARASFVLEKRAGNWLIVHAHFSSPVAGQQQGQSF